jgi:hypothetical protein
MKLIENKKLSGMRLDFNFMEEQWVVHWWRENERVPMMEKDQDYKIIEILSKPLDSLLARNGYFFWDCVHSFYYNM